MVLTLDSRRAQRVQDCSGCCFCVEFIWAGVRLPLLSSSKGGYSMSRQMLKPLRNDTGHPNKKWYPKRYLQNDTGPPIPPLPQK